MWTNPQKTVYLLTFTKKCLTENFIFSAVKYPDQITPYFWVIYLIYKFESLQSLLKYKSLKLNLNLNICPIWSSAQ